MDRDSVLSAITDVLKEIQDDSGYEPVSITAETCPLDDLEGFDSDVWVAATTLISVKLGQHIPFSKNIWVGDDGKKLRLEETVRVIMSLTATGKAKNASS